MVVVAIVLIILIIAFFVAAQMSGSNDPFQNAAAGLGLKHSRSVPELLPRIEGIVNGMPIRIDVPKQGAPVRYRVFYPPLGMALRLEKETTVSRTMGGLGQTDQQVGEATFDNTFKVNTSRPDALREMMTPELRRTLVKLLEAYPRMVIEDGGMVFRSDTAQPTQEEIVQTTAAMAAAAHQLVANRPLPLQKPEPQPRPEPKEVQPPTSLGQAAKAEQHKPASTAPASRQERPRPSPDPAIPTPPPQPPPPPLSTPQPDTGLPEGFYEDAFGANRMSYETDGKFEQKYQGKKVSLSGTVKQAREVEDDNTVRVGPSTKATVTVAQIDNDLYGRTDIDAIVFFPQGLADNLARGDSIAFSGRLETIDPFMRNLFITEARLQS